MNENEKQKRLPFFGIPKLFPYLYPYRFRIISMILLGGVSSAIDAAYPLFNRYALDHFVGERTLRGIQWFVALYLILLFGQGIINYVSSVSCGKVEMMLDRDLRNDAFSHLQTLSFAYYNANSVGYIHARVMSDSGLIGEAVSWRMMNLVWNGFYVAGVFVVMLIINLRLALIILLLVPVAVLLMTWFQRKLLYYNRKIREINSKITGNYNEGITGARTIKVLGVEEKMIGDFTKETQNMRRTSIREAHFSALFISTVAMMSALTLSLVLWQGGRLTMEGLMMIGTLSVFMSYALELLEPIQSIIETLSAFIAIEANIERVTRLLAEESDVTDTSEVIEKYGDAFRPKRTNFNLKVPAGTNVAIVGETGAGKSTLVNLVCRFYEPTKGQVLIDGRDARARSLLWLHSNIGYVLQSPHLFSGTVRENLRYGKPDATDEEIMEALRIVSAESVLAKMEKGLDTDVGEGGGMLSTGEKQLLSFARAILADPRILVLDEATSSIDTVTEKAIQNAIAAVIKGRTSFVIAHRLSTIVDADVILVVKGGKIIGRGTHEELMRQKGYYYELYTRQYEELLWGEVS